MNTEYKMTIRDLSLLELHDKYGAGKGRFLIARYEELFMSLRNRDIKLLELGIWKGGSLKMWKDYFPKSSIVGLDRDKKLLVNEPRIKSYAGDQADEKLLIEICEKNAPEGFDIIIDDASHIGELTRKSFRYLFKYLKSGGIYVIEDWFTGYRPPKMIDGKMIDMYGGNSYIEGENHLAGTVGFVKELLDDLALEKTIERIVYFDLVVFVYKK